MKWEEFREVFEHEKLPSLSRGSGETYRATFNALEDLLHPQRVKDVTASRISTFQAKLREKGLRETTIAKHLRHVKAALNWGKKLGIVARVPAIEMPKRAKCSKVMKGRPITAEEFERMLAKVESVVGVSAAPSWRYFLEGLWWSGLRLSEALELYWDRDDRLMVDLSGKRPMLRIVGEFEKGRKDRVHPMAPEFAEFLDRTPAADRVGRVFDPQGFGKERRRDWMSRVGAAIGKAAGVKVNTDPKTAKTKYASLHDLRRSFGERWARRILPQQLKELMRHEAIETTLRYYVGQDAENTADALWGAYSKAKEATPKWPAVR